MNNVLQMLLLSGTAFLFTQEVVATSATANSAAIDSQGKGDALFIIHPGVTTGAPTSVTIQDSADGSTDWTDITNAAPGTLPTATDDGKIWGIIVTKVGTAHRRYLRLQWVQSGTGSTTLDALCIFANGREFPDSAADAGYEDLAIA